MPRNVIQYDLLISCPGDIKEELSLVTRAVDEFNNLFSDALGLSIRPKHWKTNSYAQSGGKPQELLNEQFVNDCDAAVALFWTRFGTPTDEYGSGTEEEIEIMLNSNKQVFMYFSDKPFPPSQHDAGEYSRVQAFREKYKERGVYFTYATDNEFYELFFAHLTQHFMTQKRVAEVRAERKSNLLLKGIDESGKLSDVAVFQKLTLNTRQTTECRLEEIKRLISEISSIHVRKNVGGIDPFSLAFNSPVEVSDGWIDVITAISKEMNVDLPSDFFCVGNLTKNPLADFSSGTDAGYRGSEEEKQKFRLLESLYMKIAETFDWMGVERGYNNISCVKLALTNTGTRADDEIDVTLRIPRHLFMTLDELPSLEESTMRFLTRDCDLYELFGICSSAEYVDYDSTAQKTPSLPNGDAGSIFSGYVNYEEDYKEELEDVFCYRVFVDGDDCVIKITFDHLKHHNTAAFPAGILLKEKPDEICYTITSGNSEDVISGKILVK